jgi:hypothetical protein
MKQLDLKEMFSSRLPAPVKDRWRRFRSHGIGSYIGWDDLIASAILLMGFGAFFEGPIPYIPILTDVYISLGAEMVGIGMTVLIIANASEVVSRQSEKKRLISQMGSPNNGLAVDAARQLRVRGWLFDGSLREADLYRANLKGADLANADLRGAKMKGVNLDGANLEKADLRSVDMSAAKVNIDLDPPEPKGYKRPRGFRRSGAAKLNANMTGADLRGANLTGADLSGAILENADLRGTNMKDAQLGLYRYKDPDVDYGELITVREAVLRSALYDEKTVWGVYGDPVGRKAIMVDEAGNVIEREYPTL